jgi:hypothetical protein
VRHEHHGPDALLFLDVRLLTVRDEIRWRRLLCFGRLLHAAPSRLPQFVEAGASAQGSWSQLVMQGLAWLFSADTTFASLPDPTADAETWCRFVLEDLGRCSRRVRARFAITLEDAWLSLKLLHGDAPILQHVVARQDALAGQLRRVLGQGAAASEKDSDDQLTGADFARKVPVACPERGLMFASIKLVGHHRRFKHRVPSARQLYATGTICQMCATEFHTRPRLAR